MTYRVLELVYTKSGSLVGQSEVFAGPLEKCIEIKKRNTVIADRDGDWIYHFDITDNTWRVFTGIRKKANEDIVHRVAAVQHEVWSHWMAYMFSCGKRNDDGTWTMPADKVLRWHRQMNTPYDDLTEREKQSDIDQAYKVMRVL